jgi:hypothetical protein
VGGISVVLMLIALVTGLSMLLSMKFVVCSAGMLKTPIMRVKPRVNNPNECKNMNSAITEGKYEHNDTNVICNLEV